MLSIEEMSAWSVDEIALEIRAKLPDAMAFQSGFDSEAGVWVVRFVELGEKGERVSFEDWGPELRLLHLNAYGWLWQKTRPSPPASSPWVRRREVTHEAVRRTAKEMVADPGDLDPSEIQAVYGGMGQPK